MRLVLTALLATSVIYTGARQPNPSNYLSFRELDIQFTGFSDDSFLPFNPYALNMTAQQCNATCASFEQLEDSCITPHCGCNLTFLSFQGYCSLCQVANPVDAAAIQILTELDLSQCRSEGFQLDFSLRLSTDAQEVVDQIHTDGLVLRRQQRMFLTLQILGGHVGLPLLLAFSALNAGRVRRELTFINFCITWIFSSVVFSLQLYRDLDDHNFIVPLGLISSHACVVQGALTEGAQVLTATSTLAWVIQMWLRLRRAIKKLDGREQSPYVPTILYIIPYLSLISVAAVTAFVGSQRLDIENTITTKVIPTNFYCSLAQSWSLHFIYGVNLALYSIMILLDIHVVWILRRHWLILQSIEQKNAIPLPLFIRVVAFSFFRIIVAAAYGTVLNSPIQLQGSLKLISITFDIPVWVDLLQASIPLVAAIIFAANIQASISAFYEWFQCLRKNSPIGKLRR